MSQKAIPVRGHQSVRIFARVLAIGILLLEPLHLRIPVASCTPSTESPAVPDPLSLIDAVKVMLILQPEIRIAEQQVLWNRSLVQQALGQFDVNLQAGLSQRGDTVPISPLAQLTYQSGQQSLSTYTTNYYAAASKQFRFGMTSSLSLQYNRVDQNALPAPYGQSVLVFSVQQPLLRGRGADSTAAVETAAKIQQEVSELQLRQAIAQRIRDVCVAYWSYVASSQQISRWTEAETRARDMLSDEQRLVQLGQHPASNLKLLSANLAELTAARSDAQRQALEARQALGLAMGLSWQQTMQLGTPSTDFGSLPESSLPPPDHLQALIQSAWTQRADVLAASAMIRAAQTQSRAAQRGTEPRLDAQVDLGYAGLAEGTGAAPFFTAPYQNVAGLNFFAGLNFQFPVQNNTAKGLMLQRTTEQAQAVLVRDNLQRQIGGTLAVLAASLRAAVLSQSSTEAAVIAYQGAVEDERKKVRAGLSTTFDLIQVQSRLNTASQNALLARARVASLVAQARYESGMLVVPRGDQTVLHLEQLTTFPSVQSAAP